MRIIRTHEQTRNSISDQWELDQIYNGLDCAVTYEVLEVLLPQLDSHTAATYRFSRSLQGPALEMRLRGVLVDQARKAEVIDEFSETLERLEAQLEHIVLNGVGMTRFNWRSPDDLKMLFYNKLGLPEVRSKGRVTVDRKALERLEAYLIARQIVLHILAMRDIGKKISVLKTEIDHDGRMRSSYNIAGTSTGRFSSSFSEFGTGGNLQNVEESLRSIFISDPGMKFAKFDAKSGESYCVGATEWNLFNDGRYLDAVESGDVHTAVARICWPDLPWTGDLKHDKAIAEQPYYRHYTYRFMCKKLGHGSNYGGEPATLAAQAKLPEPIVQRFQPVYFGAFPAHLDWHASVASQLRRVGFLISLTGRKRWFLGRRSDPGTLREAIAYDPQCSLADIVNRAMLRIWLRGIAIQMMHDHDALTFMYPEDREDEVVPLLAEALLETIALSHGRELQIPYDCKTGWNKGDFHASTNPDGLKDYIGEDKRRRTPQVRLLDRVIRAKHRAA
jgi:DNA polymerase I-like protein with 3'-5' exonuclease and polymerase domains